MKRYHMTVEEFDMMEIEEDHKFSEKYLKNKQLLLERIPTENHGWTGARIATAAAATVLVPTVVYAAGSWLGFFEGAWGNKGKENSTAYTETIEVEGVEKSQLHPAIEYEEPDIDYAEQKIAPSVQELPISIDLQGTTLTVNTVVRDALGNAVVEYTLERDGGILTGLNQLSNGRTKYGAVDNYTVDYSIHFACGLKEACSEYSYKDESRSTDSKWYCYAYIIYDEAMFKDHAKWIVQSLENRLKESTDEYYEYWRKDFESLNGKPFTKEDYAEWREGLKKDLEYWENPPMDDQGLIIDYSLFHNMEDRETENGSFSSEDHLVTVPLEKKRVETLSFASDTGRMIAEISPISLQCSVTSDSAPVSVIFKDGTEYIVEDSETLNYYNSLISGGKCQIMFNRLVKIEEIEKLVISGNELYLVK